MKKKLYICKFEIKSKKDCLLLLKYIVINILLKMKRQSKKIKPWYIVNYKFIRFFKIDATENNIWTIYSSP